MEKIEIFINHLSQHANAGEMFFLEEMLLNLTIDIIGGAVMCVSLTIIFMVADRYRDHDFQSQSRYNDRIAAFRGQLSWSTTGIEINLLSKLNFLRPFVHIYNAWRMNRCLVPRLEERYNLMKGKHANPGKSVIDLAL